VSTVVQRVESWNATWKRSLSHLGFGIGSTGDDTPWHGRPWDDKRCISKTDWQAYWDASTLHVAQAAKGLVHETAVRVNFGYCDEIVPQVAAILGNGSFTLNMHERCKTYQQTGDAMDINASASFVYAAVTEGKPPHVGSSCWWDKFTAEGQPASSLNRVYWPTVAWSLFSGVDALVGPGCDLASSDCIQMSAFFNKYAGHKSASPEAPGAWVLLHVGLDGSDSNAFPAASFGPPVWDNADRMAKIALAYSAAGAEQDDPKAAATGAQSSRRRQGLNDAGWGIFVGNYQMGMTQLGAGTTQVTAVDLRQARWRVGPATQQWGRFARVATVTTPLQFVVDTGVFEGKAALHLRVVYLDGGSPSAAWQLEYAAAGGSTVSSGGASAGCTAHSVQLAHTNKWQQLCVEIPSGSWQGQGACGGADIVLKVAAAEEAFAFVELSKIPFEVEQCSEVVRGSPVPPADCTL